MDAVFAKILNDKTEIYITQKMQGVNIDYTRCELCPDGYFPLIIDNEPPELNEGEELIYRFYISNNEIHREYLKHNIGEELPGVKHIYSKLNLYIILQSMGLWTTLRTWMENQTLPNGVNVATAYDMAVELADDNELFNTYVTQAAAVLNIPEEQVMAILAQCRKNV